MVALQAQALGLLGQICGWQLPHEQRPVAVADLNLVVAWERKMLAALVRSEVPAPAAAPSSSGAVPWPFEAAQFAPSSQL